MPRRRALALLAFVAVAACGEDDDPVTSAPAAPATVTAAAPAATTASTSSTPAPTTTVDDVADPELRAELLAMLEEDQAVRTGVAPLGDGRTADELFAAMDEVDRANQARLAEVFDQHGWPGWALVGVDGSTAAWAIVQHADLDVAFQERGLALLEGAVARGDASPGDLAYLTDRVRVAKGEPQVYGTQWSPDETGEWVPRTPIEDEAGVDARRAAAGLGTIDEYLDELRALEASG